MTMRIILLAATAALLAGCSASPADWSAETVPAVLIPAAPAVAPRPCPPLDAAMEVEAQRTTPIATKAAGDVDELAATLMSSEAAKNARLRQALAAYESCRRR